MRLYRIENNSEIYKNEKIVDVLSQGIINPSLGKIQNIAQSVYSKQQGVFFTAEDDNKIVGVIGLKRINDRQVEIMHLVVSKEYRLKGFAKEMIFEAKDLLGVPELIVESEYKELEFYKKIGFRYKKMPEQGLDYDRYLCTLR